MTSVINRVEKQWPRTLPAEFLIANHRQDIVSCKLVPRSATRAKERKPKDDKKSKKRMFRKSEHQDKKV